MTKIKKIEKIIDDGEILISTWQSLNNGKTKMPKQWYNQFGSVFGDEAHTAKAMLLKNILESMENCKYRFGTTGTLDSNPLNVATIEGLFGPQYKAISTAEMIERGFATKLKIKCIVLKYPDEVKKAVAKMTYNEELDTIIHYQARTNFIKNLALSLEGNKLIFFRKRNQGDLLYKAFEGNVDNLYYVDGTVKGEKRELIRKNIENVDDAVFLGSLGTVSTGVNMKKLHHMIAAAPQKSETKVPQSIGRMLRLHDSKDEAILYDIVDDLTWKSRQNYALRHFLARVKMYDADQFPYKIYNVRLK